MQGACIFPEKTPVEQRCRKALSYCFVIIALFMIFGPASAEYILPDSLLTDSIVIAGNSGIPIVAPDTFSQVPPGSSSQASAGKPWAAGLSPESAGNLELRIEETLYAFRYDERSGSWSAQNHAQQSSIRADRSGAVTIASANGSIGMQLTALGRDGNYWRAGPGTPGGDGTRLTIQRDGNTEWYVNDNAGIEHGMDIAARTDGTGPLRAIFSLSGDLTPSLAGQDVVFSDEGGPVFQYTGLIAQDARGNHLPARLILDGTTLSWEIDDDGAHYPIRIDPVVTQVKILSASHGVIKDYFGTSVAVSGDTAIIGSPHANSGDFALAGKAYVLSRNQGGANNWGEVKILTASDAAAKNLFGDSVAIDGETVLVGSPFADSGGHEDAGKAYVFNKDQGGVNNWGQVAIISASDKADSDLFGYAVAVDGTTAIVGASDADSGGTCRGQAYVFSKDHGGENTWGQVKILTASDAANYDYFGYSVAVDGTTAIVGARGADSVSFNCGQAYIFSKDHGGENTWGQVKILSASDKDFSEYFGSSVSVDSTTAIVGAPGADSGGSNRGQAYIFSKDHGGENAWGQVKILTASDAADNDSFGNSVAIDGDTALVGAPDADPGELEYAGKAYVFSQTEGGVTNWGQVKILTASDAAESDYYYFGESVAIDGDTALIGAPEADLGGLEGAGEAYVFSKDQGGVNNWGQVKNLSASDPTPKSDFFGFSVAVSGNVAIIGAMDAEPDWTEGAGEAYIFSKDQGGVNNWGQVKILTASDMIEDALFGYSVAIDGDTALVGSRDASSGGNSYAGKAYIFSKDQGGANTWGEVKILTASDADYEDSFGTSVAIDGTTAIVGAPGADSGGSNRGQAYIFSKDHGGENTWGQVKILTASDAADDDSFGYSVAIDGDTALVGSPEAGFEGCADAGKAYVFARNQGGANNWGEVKILTPSDSDTHNFFGYSVAIDGDTALIGSPEADPGGREDAGQAYVFTRNQGSANNWGQVKILTASDAADNYYFGESVAVDGDTALVGSPKADSGGREEAGKAYVFKKDQSGVNNWGEVKILTTSDATKSDYFGESVAVDGDTALGGSPGPDSWEDNVKTGKAYVFAFSPSPPPPQPTPPTSDSDNPANVQPQQAPLQQQLHTMDVNVGGNSAIRSVGVSGTGISGLIVTAMTRPGPGPNIEPPAGNVYQYIEIVPARFTTIDEATITFTIPDAWLEEHGFSPENIVLYHYENNKWVALPTTVSGTQNGIVTFTATSPGFSLFAIAGTPGSPAAPEVKTFGELAASPRPAAESPPGQRAPVVTQTPAAPAIIPASFGIPLLPLLALTGIIILAAGGFVVRRWWMRRQNPALFEEYD